MVFEVRCQIAVTEPDPELRADVVERDTTYVEKHFPHRWRVVGSEEELLIVDSVESATELDALLRGRPLYRYATIEVRPLIDLS